jgi:acetyl-CoA acetyltransferase
MSDDYYTDIFKKVVACQGDKLTSITHKEWNKIQENYAYSSLVKITVQNFIEDSFNGGRDYLIIGKTMDEHAVNVAFKVYNKTEEELSALLNNTEFNVTTSKLIWKRADEVFPVDVKQPMDDWPGVPLLQAYNPQPVLLLENNVH